MEIQMSMADQWRGLFLLADAAMLDSEKEETSDSSWYSSSSDLSDDRKWFDAPIKKKKRTALRSVSVYPPMNGVIRGERVVTEKRLTKTDVNRNNNGLSSDLSDDEKWFDVPIKKKKRTVLRSVSVYPPMNGVIGGETAVMVTEKRLTKTDVNRNNSRLSLTGKIMCKNLEQFLRDDEGRSVREKAGLEVTVVDGNGREYDLVLKLWNMATTKVYNIISGWNTFAVHNALKENDVVRVKAFRRGDEPCFAVIKLSDRL